MTATATKKIIIADPHFLVRQGLNAIFTNNSKYEVVADTGDYNQIIPSIELNNPDVVIIGQNIQGISAAEIIVKILKAHSHKKILVLDTNEDTLEIVRLLKLGVHGYILKQCDRLEILEAVASILVGKRFFCSNVLKLNKSQNLAQNGKNKNNGNAPIQLSEREMEVLELLSQGLTNNEIGEKIFISMHTVASHRKSIMRKFGAKNNVDLVISAIKKQFITL